MESTVEDILKTVDRFRILCVGRSGVGKSSVINRVFGLQKASVAHWETGEADIEKPLTSDDNRFLVLHDSKGFEPGDTQTFDIVRGFIEQRRDNPLLKDRLHAVWLCTETPRAGGRVFETGDERLLQLAHEAQIPIVVVFTKYDGLVWSKRKELEEDNINLGSEELDKRGKEEAQKVLNTCVQSVVSTFRRLSLNEQKIRHANVSINAGYEASISSLVEVTRVVVQEKVQGDAWVVWGVTQRASLPLKIEICINSPLNKQKHSPYLTTLRTSDYQHYIDSGQLPPVTLHDFLAGIHQDIITCWNFKDEGAILGNDRFKQLVLYLVEDVQEPQNDGKSHDTYPRAIKKILQSLDSLSESNTASTSAVPPLATTQDLTDWPRLRDAFLHESPKVRRLLMTYIIGLTTVLRSLFDVKLSQIQAQMSRKPEPEAGIIWSELTWSELKEAFEAYERSGSRRRIHDRISQIFQQDQQISDTSFSRIFRELVTVEDAKAKVPAPEPAPGTRSNPAPGVPPEPERGQSFCRRLGIRLPCLCA